MTEPRARAGRHKSALNFPVELEHLLTAYGAPAHPDMHTPHADSTQYLNNLPTANVHHRPTAFDKPFPETLRVLDEILTDFIIETCHTAVSVASYSNRAKLKLSDFEWVIRKDKQKLGRVQTMLAQKKKIDAEKSMGVAKEGEKVTVDMMQELGQVVGEEGTGKGKGRGKGKRKKKRELDEMLASGALRGNGDGAGEDDLEMDEDVKEPKSKKARSEVG